MLSVIRVFSVACAILLCVQDPSAAGLDYLKGTSDDGLRFVVVRGSIEFEDDLREFDQVVRDHKPTAITFNSSGGNIVKALELGRLIRRHGLSTHQSRRSQCVSACAFVFMGGAGRSAEPGAIGMHKSSFSGSKHIDTADAVSALQDIQAEIIQYMDEMGVNPALLTLALRYDADDVRYLSKREMEEYQLVTVEEQSASTTINTQPSRFNYTVPTPPKPNPIWQTLNPVARSGAVRHPKGSAQLKRQPTPNSTDIGKVANGTAVEILKDTGRWYFVSVGSVKGYMHHTSIRVDQFEHSPGLLRHIQVKSFKDLEAGRRYVSSSPIPLSLYLSTSGWYAVTLAEPMERSAAIRLKNKLTGSGDIPGDSFVTFGNTYKFKACCD